MSPAGNPFLRLPTGWQAGTHHPAPAPNYAQPRAGRPTKVGQVQVLAQAATAVQGGQGGGGAELLGKVDAAGTASREAAHRAPRALERLQEVFQGVVCVCVCACVLAQHTAA